MGQSLLRSHACVSVTAQLDVYYICGRISQKKKKVPQEVSGNAELAAQSSNKRAKVRECS